MTAKLLTVTVLSATALALLLPRPAAAVDGVIEINQARALVGGVTATDTPGFPVTIDSSGSYRLTGNLTVPPGPNGIEIVAAVVDVTLDLNGFGISGDLAPPCCSAGVIANGIANGRNVHVLNGSLRGLSNGIYLQDRAAIEHVHQSRAASTGILVGPHATISDSVAETNLGAGISVGPSRRSGIPPLTGTRHRGSWPEERRSYEDAQ